MKRILKTGAVVGGVLLTLSLAYAGEGPNGRPLGIILASDAGTANNFNTGYLTAGCSTTIGTCDQAFKIPTAALISVQCDQSAFVAVNNCYVDAGSGVKVAADQFFTSSTAPQSIKCPAKGDRTDDGGSFLGGVVSIAPAVGNSLARCKVFARQGNE